MANCIRSSIGFAGHVYVCRTTTLIAQCSSYPNESKCYLFVFFLISYLNSRNELSKWKYGHCVSINWFLDFIEFYTSLSLLGQFKGE